MSTFTAQLTVKPKPGVRDPQGKAVQESLEGVGYRGLNVHSVGRVLHFDIDAKSEAEATSLVDEMCKRLLVNPNLETYELKLFSAS